LGVNGLRETRRLLGKLQVLVNPTLRRGPPIHDSAFAALRELGADYVRYVPWLPYPRLAVAELEPDLWDFSLIDPMTLDFLHATEGHSTIVNFSTIPACLFRTHAPVRYPVDPNQVVWNYTRGTELSEGALKKLGDYYARVVSGYTKGGFTDAQGHQHTSAYHFNIPYWEVFRAVFFFAAALFSVTIRGLGPSSATLGPKLDPSHPVTRPNC
jgi:hypothetical protein